MAVKTVDASEAQVQFRALLDYVRAGHDVLIAEGAQAVAKLVPVLPRRRIAGLTRGAAHAAPDFDAPLPDGYWDGTP